MQAVEVVARQRDGLGADGKADRARQVLSQHLDAFFDVTLERRVDVHRGRGAAGLKWWVRACVRRNQRCKQN